MIDERNVLKIVLIHVYQFSFLTISNIYRIFSNYFRLCWILSIFCFFIEWKDAVFLCCWVVVYSIMKYMKCLKITFSKGTISFSHTCTFQEKFSLRYNNLGELTLWWLAQVWHFMVVSCKQIKSHEGELEWTPASTKVTPVSCKHPLRAQYWGESAKW